MVPRPSITAMIVLLLLAPLLTNLARGGAASATILIVSNEFDMPAADLLAEELRAKGYDVRISGELEQGSKYVFVLGGHLARGTGSLSSKFLQPVEKKALVNVKGFWTFTVSPKEGRHFVVVAGHTRVETKLGVEILIESGILELILDESIEPFPPISERDMRNTTEISFEWRYPPKVGKRYRLELELPKPLVDFFRVKPRLRVAEFKEGSRLLLTWYLMVATPHDDFLLRDLVSDMLREASDLEDYELLDFFAAFVQHIGYSLAHELSPTGDYPSYPVETLERGEGDCEDKSILLISLYQHLEELRRDGKVDLSGEIDSLLLLMPTHAAVGLAMPPEWVRFQRVNYEMDMMEGIPVVWVDLRDLAEKREKGPVALEFELDGRSYFYVETTAFMRPGELPDLNWLAERAGWPYEWFPIFVVPIKGEPIPLISDLHIIIRRVGEGYGATLLVEVANLGDEAIDGLTLTPLLVTMGNVEVGGVDPKVIPIEGGGEVTVISKERSVDIEIGSLEPGKRLIYAVNFYTNVDKLGAVVKLMYGNSELDYLRTKLFRAKP